MLEILRDRWAAALKEMMDREEQKQIDEQVLFSFQGSGAKSIVGGEMIEFDGF